MRGLYQFQRLKTEGEKRGHTLSCCRGKEVRFVFGQELSLQLNDQRVDDFDLIRFQAVSEHKDLWNVVAYTALSKHIPIVDKNFLTKPKIQSLLSESIMAHTMNIREPKSTAVYSLENALLEAQQYSFPFVIKTISSRKGRGVALVRSQADIEKFFVEQSSQEKTAILLREYIPNMGDLRVLVVGNKVIGAMARHPSQGEFRANISQGGTGSLFDIATRPDIAEMALKATKIKGLDIAGVDIMIHKETQEAYLLEVNSSPQIVGFEKYTGINLAEKFIQFFEELVKV